jgi:adenylylsulfate kinase
MVVDCPSIEGVNPLRFFFPTQGWGPTVKAKHAHGEARAGRGSNFNAFRPLDADNGRRAVAATIDSGGTCRGQCRKVTQQLRSRRRIMAEQKATNVTWHEHAVSKDERLKLAGHKGAVLWFTGLSASGKSTVANVVDHKLHSMGKRSFVLDGDNIRMGLNKNLGFSADDRAENIRRIGEVAKLFSTAGVIAVTAFISPYRKDRDAVRALLPEGEFLEIFMNTSLELCEKRDPKGLYKKARAGQLKGFTGIDDPYEAPEKPELVLDGDTKSIDELADEVIAHLQAKGLLSL